MNRLLMILLVASLLSSCGTKKVEKECPNSKASILVKPKGFSFVVSDVEIANSFLKVDSAQYVFENKIGKEILFFPKEHSGLEIVSCPNNGLIQTIQECYDNHRPLILTPDIIWLTICQGVSIHINEHYDSLKNVIFVKNKPDKLVIRNDSLEYSGKHWIELIESFSVETKKYTKSDFYSFFVSDFSTTTPIEKAAYQITLLESYKKAFEYVGETGCGIPSILIAGSPKDWQQILKKLEKLDCLGLSNWKTNLIPIIKEFLLASKGSINKEFWQEIYKNASEYNAFYISGWIIKLFPYIKELDASTSSYDNKRDETRMSEVFKTNLYMDGDNYLLSTLSTDNFPSGVSKIKVIWNNYFKGTEKNIEVYSGFFGIRQYDDKSLMPLVSWAICDEKSKPIHHNVSINEALRLVHHPEYWSPNILKNITDSAIYDIKQFKSQSQSLQYVSKLISVAINENADFKDVNYENDTVEVEILSNGTIGHVRMPNSQVNTNLIRFITDVLNKLPEKWFPALSHPTDVLDLMDFPEDENKIKIRANSKVYFRL